MSKQMNRDLKKDVSAEHRKYTRKSDKWMDSDLLELATRQYNDHEIAVSNDFLQNVSNV